MSPEQLIPIALFMVSSSITPGPNNTMLMTSGVNFGVRRTMPHFLGVQIGFAVLLFSVGLGLHGALAQFPILFDAVRYLGAAYMLFLYRRVAFGKITRDDLRSLLDLGPREYAVFAPLILLTLWMGVYPSSFLDFFEVTVASLVQRHEAALGAARLAGM